MLWVTNFAGFQCSKTSANKRLFIMSATLRRRCADIPSAGSRCKGTTFFSFVQGIAQKNRHLLFRERGRAATV